MVELRVRGAADKTEALRKTALKNGAVGVTTRTVAPNQDESVVSFKKKADFNKFADWVKKSRDCAVVLE